MNIDDFVESFHDTKILSLGEMIRYNNRQKIKQESVATHTFVAATSLFKICEYYKISREIRQHAIELIIVHDIPELVSNDLPYNFKKDNEEIKTLLRRAEMQYMKEKMPEYYEVYKELDTYEDTAKLPYLLVKMADVISVYLYSFNELELGNKTTEMKDIYYDSIERIKNLDGQIISFLSFEEQLVKLKDWVSKFDWREMNELL